MAYPRSFLRLVVSGTLYTVEGFSYTLSLLPTSDTASPPATVPTAVVDAISTFTAASSSAAASVRLIKLNEIGTTGKYTQANTVLLDRSTAPINGVGSVYHAPQVSLAVSLGTSVNRGLASKGRFFIPAPKWVVSGTGLMTSGDQTNASNAVQAFLNSLNAAVPGYVVGVASDTREGAMRSVRTVAVGGALDTIRSRRTDMPENKTVSPPLTSYSAVSYGVGSFVPA